MGTKLTETVAFRCEPGLKRLLEREAEAVRLRPGDWLRRLVEQKLGYAPDLRKSQESSRTPQEIEWSEPDDDQE